MTRGLSHELLALAIELARREKGKPRQASLRRAISTAYYALFHLLIESATRALLGTGAEEIEMRGILARAFDHGEMAEASKGFKAGSLPKILEPALKGAALSEDLKVVATALLDLQTERHLADYDTSKRFHRAPTRSLVRSAEDAFAAWARVERTGEARLFLLALLVGKKVKAR